MKRTGPRPFRAMPQLAPYLVSASLLAVAVSNWTRPGPVSAQATEAGPRPMRAEARAAVTALQDAFVSLAERVEPSVVTITARAATAAPEKPADPKEGSPERRLPSRTATGSGVIIRESGNTVYVLTNNHVVEGRSEFRIETFDDLEHRAELVGRDPRTDLAVLRFRTEKPLPPGSVARFGESREVKVGQWAIAIGSPLGYRSTFTVGVVSAKGRVLGGSSGASLADLVQTDASINPGNSGGPLLNIEGEVIGINVAIASNGARGNIGIGFAVPADTARLISEQLIASGRVARGFLGVQVSAENRDLSPAMREKLGVPQGGALVEAVAPNTPAASAGLKEGDVIVRFGGHPIASFTDLERAMAATPPGTEVAVEIVRNRKPLRLTVRTAEPPDAVAKN